MLNRTRAFAISVVALSVTAAWAQETITTAPVSGGAVRLSDGIFVYPSVKLSAGRNDNVTGVPKGGEISSNILSLQPRVVAETKQAANRYTLLYQGDYTRFTSSSADNFQHHTLEAAGDHAFTARSRLGWAVNWLEKTDPRDATTAAPGPDEWRGLGARALYIYGAQGAKGRVEAEYAYFNKRYQNNKAFGSTDSDVDNNALAGRFFWRVMPKTFVVTELRYADNNYRVNNTNDNTDTRLLAGVTWEATAKTTGVFKVGHQRKNYSGARADYSGSTYEGSVNWSPLTYSTVSLTARRSAEDSSDAGVDYLRNSSLGLAWTHQWNSRVASRVSVSDANSRYVNDPAGRKDSTLNMGLGMTYQLGKNYVLGLDLNRTDNDSTVNTNDFKRNTVLVTLQAQL